MIFVQDYMRLGRHFRLDLLATLAIFKVIQELMVLKGKQVILVLQEVKVPNVIADPQVKEEQREILVLMELLS